MSSQKRKSNGGNTSSHKRRKTAQELTVESRNTIARIPTSDLTNDIILDYVTQVEPPFIVRSQPLDKKLRKLVNPKDLAQLESSLPKGKLLHKDSHAERNVLTYGIHPQNVWDHLRRYKKFTLGDPDKGTHMSAGPGDYILVKHDDSTEEAILDRDRQWKAQVQEIRALDAEHVWVRVAWLNRPADLGEDGKKDTSHYGKMELIPTNQLDIIDAMTVNGQITVDFWNERNDNADAPRDPSTYYWRHTYDAAVSRQFTPPLRKICICQKPMQPDKLSIRCENSACALWQHADCLLKDFASKKPLGEEKTVPQLDYDKEKLERGAAAHLTINKGTTYLFTEPGQHALVHVSGTSERRGSPVLCLKCHTEIP